MTGSALMRWTLVHEPGGYVYIGGGLEGDTARLEFIGDLAVLCWRVFGLQEAFKTLQNAPKT
eukprot:12373072-Karenia_brevis.AAC.1